MYTSYHRKDICILKSKYSIFSNYGILGVSRHSVAQYGRISPLEEDAQPAPAVAAGLGLLLPKWARVSSLVAGASSFVTLVKEVPQKMI